MRLDDHAIAPTSPSLTTLADDRIEVVLRWAVIERGTAELSERLERDAVAPNPPACFLPPLSAIAGRVVLLRRRRPADGARPPSSFDEIRRRATPGSVLLVGCEPGIGAAFGSNVALLAATCRVHHPPRERQGADGFP